MWGKLKKEWTTLKEQLEASVRDCLNEIANEIVDGYNSTTKKMILSINYIWFH